MAVPVVAVRIDWGNDGAFTGAYDDVTARVMADSLTWTRGRSADFSTEATGAASFTLLNSDDRFTPDRNWCDNPSFEADTAGWSVAAVAGVSVAGTSITQVTDNAGQGGTKAGEAVLTATQYSGVTYQIPYRFRAGVTYSVAAWMKSTSGNLNVGGGVGVIGDYGGFSGPITTAWAQYSGTWTPSADTSAAVFFVRTTTAAAATVRIDAVQVNPGAAANTYIEAPTRGELIPGRPVHIYATYSATDYPAFFGYIQRLSPDPRDPRSVTITCYDVFSVMADTTAVVPYTGVMRTVGNARRQVLEEFARGTRNLCCNPSFETDTANWTTNNATLTRITTDHAPDAGGTACGQITLSDLGTNEGVLFICRTLPRFHTGETYRVAFYAKLVSGPADYEITLAGNTGVSSKPITLTGQWARYTVTGTLTAPSYAYAGGLSLRLRSATRHAGVVLIDGAMVTRGKALYPYADVGTGRWANHVFNGDFEGGAAGWTEPYTNICTNGSFETNTTGWSVAGDSFVSAATSITRVSGTAKYGTYRGELVTTTGNSGVFYAVTGTFLAGFAYHVSVYCRHASAARNMKVGIGSNGTPADFALSTGWLLCGATYRQLSVDWVPTADRTDVHVYLTRDTSVVDTIYIDGLMVTRGPTDLDYADTGPLGGGVHAVTVGVSDVAPYAGGSHLAIECRPVATSGCAYDLHHSETGFNAGQQMSVSLYARVASGTAPLKVGISVNDQNGGFDEASATLAATTSYQRVALTWTPTAERTVNGPMDGCVSVLCTDASGPTIYVDGVRVTPGATPEDLELPEWSLAAGAEETDMFDLPAYNFTGSVLGSLSRINDVTLARHWISATMAAPWWQYVTHDRVTPRTSAETYDDDLQDMTAAEIDLASVVNVLQVTWWNVSETASDIFGDESAERYGPRPGATIDTSTLTATRTLVDEVGPMLVARYRDPRARPVITVVNRFPSQLQRELDDLVTVNCARLGVVGGRYLVVSMTTAVSQGGKVWRTSYQLEEHPY